QVIDELIREKGLEKGVLENIVCEGMKSAYLKKYPRVSFFVSYDHLTGLLSIDAQKIVVQTVEDSDTEVSLKKARYLDKNVQIGDSVIVPFEGVIGRVEVLHARQIIAQHIRTIEALAVYSEFKPKENEILHGMFHKIERGGVVIKLDDGTLAFLPTMHMSPLDKAIIGTPVRCLLKEVLQEPLNDHQVILDRASGIFLRKLMELEIPEVFEKIVEIKAIARIAGYKSKIIVSSREKNIDPVGTCVGIGGSRIKPILTEIGGEKIDIIEWVDSTEEMIRSSLKPAKIERVELLSKEDARVWVEDDQRSYAIGKSGQNIALASRLLGINIKLVQKENISQLSTTIEGISDTW
ncbi:MAG TPA: transcription termination factor NusA, partial [Patescibacteria group bacterium]|nr:transcription termination factor NusA [Patescibacteria group bacterium]